MSRAGVPGETVNDSTMLLTKDAFHIPCVLCSAGGNLNPGDPVAVDMETGEAEYCNRGRADGIVDPYLKREIGPDELFWVFLRPDTISNLRHEFDFRRNPYDPDGIGCGTTCG